MDITIYQRLSAYRRLIKEIDTGRVFFLCNELRILFPGTYLGIFILEKHFPELYSVRPKEKDNITTVWFNDSPYGMQLRRKRIVEAIKICRYNILHNKQ